MADGVVRGLGGRAEVGSDLPTDAEAEEVALDAADTANGGEAGSFPLGGFNEGDAAKLALSGDAWSSR